MGDASMAAVNQVVKMAKSDQQFTAVIESVTKLRNSTNGNPKYRLHLEGGATMDTETDSQIAYAISGRNAVGHEVTITATPSGKVYDIDPLINGLRSE